MMNGQNNYDNHGSGSLKGKSKAKYVVGEDFSSNHLLKVSLMHEPQDETYKRDYFAFVSACPRGKKGNNGGSTYLTDDKHRITFKLELPKLQAFCVALRLYAMGQRINPSFVLWADSTKARNVGETTELRSGKSLTVKDAQDDKNSNSRVVQVIFNRGKESNKGSAQQCAKDDDKDKPVTIVFSPFEALAIAGFVESLVQKGRQLNFNALEGRAATQNKQSREAAQSDDNQCKSPNPARNASAQTNQNQTLGSGQVRHNQDQKLGSSPASRNTQNYDNQDYGNGYSSHSPGLNNANTLTNHNQGQNHGQNRPVSDQPKSGTQSQTSTERLRNPDPVQNTIDKCPEQVRSFPPVSHRTSREGFGPSPSQRRVA